MTDKIDDSNTPPVCPQGFWHPMVSAPLDGSRILLLVQHDTGPLDVVGGFRNPDNYGKVQRPYWATDNDRIWGLRHARLRVPLAWAPLPIPDNLDMDSANG